MNQPWYVPLYVHITVLLLLFHMQQHHIRPSWLQFCHIHRYNHPLSSAQVDKTRNQPVSTTVIYSIQLMVCLDPVYCFWSIFWKFAQSNSGKRYLGIYKMMMRVWRYSASGGWCIYPPPTHTRMNNDHLLNNRLPQTINKGTCVVYWYWATKSITDSQACVLRLRVNVLFWTKRFHY